LVGLAIVGFGSIGREHASSIVKLSEAELVGVYDVSYEARRFAREKYGVKSYGKLEELLRDPSVDGVVVCTPPYIHAEVCSKAAQAGKHVFCEKPLTASWDDALKLRDVVRSSGIKFMTGFVLRYFPVYVEVEKLLSTGKLGKVYSVLLTDAGGLYPLGAGDFRRFKRLNAGIGEQLIHEVDALRFLAGDAAKVYARGGRFKHEVLDYEDNIVILATMENGAIGTILGSLTAKLYRRDGYLICENGTVAFDLRNSTVEARIDGEEFKVKPERNNPFLDEMRDFVSWLKTGKKPKATFEDGFKAQEILEAAYRSIEESREVILPLS